MIPLAAIPWRLVGAVGLVAVVALMGWRVSAWHKGYERVKVVEAELAAERACALHTACHERAAKLAEQARLEAEKRARDALQAVQEREAKARADAAEWRKRYESARRDDPDCADWSSGAIKCPL